MAEAAVSHAVQVLGSLLNQKADELAGVEADVELLKEGLVLVQPFLGGVTRRQARNEMVSYWMSEIKEVALDAEDVVEIFIGEVHVRVGRCSCLPNRMGDEEIKSIMEKLRHLKSNVERHGILGDVREEDVEFLSTRKVEYLEPRLRSDGRDVVGLDEDEKLVLEKLAVSKEIDEGLSIAITGMAGIGKTTLAQKIYNNDEIIYNFGCRAWAAFGYEFSLEDVITQILLQLKGSLPVVESENKQNRLQMLQETLYRELFHRQYFIVLDDVWERTHLESLTRFLPRDKASRSRLLITSPNKAVLSDADCVHEMKFLDPEQSWELFLNKAFDSGVHFPRELEDIGKRIVQICQGLPLAITIAGGLVRQRRSQSEWESFLENIYSHLGNADRSSMQSILELSYHNLSQQLKSCFLCLPLFLEGAPIPAKRLIQVWIAHDLFPQDRARGGATMEDVARSCLDELINRYMVQVEDTTIDGRVKTCWVHDLIHQLSISKAKEEINFEILRDGLTSPPNNNPRHRATYCSDESFLAFPTDQNNRLRSLFVHNIGEDVGVNAPSSFWKSFQVLKVLDMEGCGVRKLPDAIGTLFWLRYLGLRRTYIDELPESMSKLENLQVLDAQGGYLKLAAFIWTMRSLRHLNSSEIWLSQRVEKCAVENLQTLGDLVLEDDQMIEQLKKMTRLTKLGIILWSISDVKKLFTSLALLENLVSLSLKSFFTLNVVEGLGDLRCITKLKLEGHINELPNAGDFPPNLSCLSLKCSGLKVDPVPVLAELPNLSSLKLDDDAYMGEEIEICDDGFAKLQRIFLRGLRNLKNINIWDGAIPELQKIFLERLGNLSVIDVDVDMLPERLRWEIKECPNLNIEKLPRSAVTNIA